MTIQKQLLRSAASSVGDRQVRVIVSDATQDRAEDVVDPKGIDYANYMNNPVVLYQHNYDLPVAKCIELGLENDQLVALCQFPPAGEVPESDAVYAKIKNGLLNAVSIGFIPKGHEELENSRWGRKFTKSEMLEFSFVSVPCNPNALIVARTIPQDGNEGAAPDPAEQAVTRILDAVDSVNKAGRTISSANEAKLRTAHAQIGEVLASCTTGEPDGDEGKAFAEKALATVQVLRLKAHF